MAFSTNPQTLEARMHLLVELKAGRACRWTSNGDLPATHRDAQRIREALYIASLYPQDYPELATAYAHFSIHVIGPGVIEAKVRPEYAKLSVSDVPIAVHGTQTFGKEQQTVNLTLAQQLIDAWLAHLPSSDPLHFPQVALDVPQLYELHDWVSKQRPKMMMLVGADERFITLSLLEIGMEEIAWHPPIPPKQGPVKELDL